MSELGIESLGASDNRPRHKHGRSCLAVLVALAVVAAVGIFVYVKGVDVLHDALSGPPDYDGNGSGHVQVAVYEDDTLTAIGATLVAAGVVKSQEAFTDAARENPDSTSIEPGYYRLHKHMSAEAALALLLNPDSQVEKTVTIPEGKWVPETLSILAKHTPLSKADFEAALKKLEKSGKLGLPRYVHHEHAGYLRQPEGYLFPATYNVPPGVTAAGLLQAMTKEFRAEAKQLGLRKAAQKRHRPPGELMTIASLVQAEVSRPKDMPKVARVIYNRLKKQMPLQMDSTVHYALQKRGTVTTTEKQRHIDSPYNTYEHKGLPPTPINSPGAKAIKAALKPAKGNWLYFVTVNPCTGKTKFAKTLKQHNAYAEQFKKFLRNHDKC